MLSDAHQRECVIVNETKVSHVREGYKCQAQGTHVETGERPRELSGAHRVQGMQLEGFPPAWAGR